MPEINDTDLLAAAVYRVLSNYFEITLYHPSEKQIVFWANPLLHKRGWKRELQRRLSTMRVRLKIERDNDRYRLTVFPLPLSIGWPPLINTLLFILTFLTVLLAAAYRESGEVVFSNPTMLVSGLPFTIALLFILLVHEMGHFISGHSRDIIMSYPYFIPAPTYLGTFGALIRTRTPIRNRRDLILVGASGPLAGAIPSLIALIWGYLHSHFVPMTDQPVIVYGNSLMTWLIQQIMFGHVPDGFLLYLSPIALAGHVGLLVTMINLLPLGQLDGGHIIYGLFGRRQKFLAILFLISLLGLGFLWNGWWLWMVLAIIMRPFHPAVIENELPLDKRHKKIGWAAVALFFLTFMPVPISIR